MRGATRPAVEILQFSPESIRANELFDALARGARARGLAVQRTRTYQGRTPWLVFWGPGAPARAETMRRHVASGGHAVALDLAYWDRAVKARVSFNAAHPQAWVMRRDLPAARFLADKVPIANLWNPTGPVVIAGLGDKARVQYGAATVDRWEEFMARSCALRWPGRPVVYRRKKHGSPVPPWASPTSLQPIEDVLKGASLVITWHSNVAVDAIRLGIPAICRDGAAAAVCPSELGPDDPQPLPTDVRDRFLANLAWFQWAPTEASAFWGWAQETVQ
jgi:hypothetical protein